MLFLDWDETISAHDTLALIAPPDGQHPGVPFGEYGKAYMEDLAKHERTWRYEGKEDDATSRDATIAVPRPSLGADWRRQWAFLGSLDEVELASQRRIEEGGLFCHFDPLAMEKRAVEQVELRTGWEGFARQTLAEDGVEYHIISVGWSARFIAAALRRTPVSPPPRSICANEVEIDPNTGRGTGRLTKSRDAKTAEMALGEGRATEHVGRSGIRTGQHKIREMRRIRATLATSTSLPHDLITVYVGDSTTDLPCLLEAGIGIVMGGKQSLRRTIDELGLDKYLQTSLQDAKPLIGRRVSSQTSQDTPFLITVADWDGAQTVLDVVRRALHA